MTELLTATDVWTEREAFPPQPPADPHDADALPAYEAAAARTLDVVRDTRRFLPGATYVTYHWALSFYGEYALAPMLNECAAALSDSGLIRVSNDRVHVPLLRLGSDADVSEHERNRIEWKTRDWATEQHQFRLNVGPPALGPGGVRLGVAPWTELIDLRNDLRRLAREVLGLRPWLRELIPFRPHAPIAYAPAELPAAPLRERLEQATEHKPVSLRIRRLTMIRVR
ncbi:MAG: 2'-5' RNA ligase family protein, partial [Actinobacteria bacterium]|nr:2'-5' RNA ligase family protein [Actinomycetota bacterium]